MMTWNRLFADFDAALAAQAERPYDPVKVQGLGMRFAEAWNYHKGPICILLGESLDDFSYVKWRDWVPAVRQRLAGPSRQAEIAAVIAAYTDGIINDPVALAAWKEQQEAWEATLDENWIGVGPTT